MSFSLKEHAQNWTPHQHLIILDMDSTLVLTHKRNEAILRRFADDYRDVDPSFSEKIKDIECRPLEYGYGAALERQGLDKADSKNLQDLATYWRRHFFSNSYLHQDLVHKGALEFVRHLEGQKIPFGYLTGRPAPLMDAGTLDTFGKLGFPVHKDILWMKPEVAMADEKFKSEKINELKKSGKKLVLIDNEPKILNEIFKEHPDVELIFVETCHSPNVQAPDGISRVKDFSEFI